MFKKINISNGIVAIVLLIVLLIFAYMLANNYLKTSFNSSSAVEMIINDKVYDIPIIEKTHIEYRTSDTSYVCLSRATLSDIYYYYLYLNGYDVKEYVRNSRIVISNDHVSFEIELIANDLKYSRYGIAVLEQEN